VNTFDHASDSLRQDLTSYAQALRTLVASLPRAQALCERVLKEVRLARALLAFASGAQIGELASVLYKLSNLWPYRDLAFARTLGFRDEIAEAQALREEARRGMALLSRHPDTLASEITTCLMNIVGLLEEEQRLLEECDASIRPHAANMELTHKRLDLLVAAVDARMPVSPEQGAALRSYGEAAELLRNWENGVPLDEQGIAILEHCIGLLQGTSVTYFAALAPAAARVQV
jgi:signal transduction histidine kinase